MAAPSDGQKYIRTAFVANSSAPSDPSSFTLSTIDNTCPEILRDATELGPSTRAQLLVQLKQYGVPTMIQAPSAYSIAGHPAAVTVSIHRQSRWLYGCWPLKGAFSQPSEAKARTKAKASYCCLHCRSTGNSRENILPEFSKFYCHPGRAGGSPHPLASVAIPAASGRATQTIYAAKACSLGNATVKNRKRSGPVEPETHVICIDFTTQSSGLPSQIFSFIIQFGSGPLEPVFLGHVVRNLGPTYRR
jgi:hypothetical protein